MKFTSAPAERFWLFSIAAIALAIVGLIAVGVIWKGEIPTDAAQLLGGAVTGLLMLAQKVIDAQGTRRAMDQLSQSSPASTENMTVDATNVEVTKEAKR